MAPLHLDGTTLFVVHLLIGIGFGFMLERARSEEHTSELQSH